MIVNATAVVNTKNKKMRGLKRPLVFLSALFFGFAFYGFYLFTFLFLIPLYWLAQKFSLTFFDGFLWGIIFFTLHSFGVMYVIWQQGIGLFSKICPLLFILYCSVYAGLWFIATCLLIKQNISSLIAWTVTTFCYFWWIDTGLFWPFGKFEGYLLAFPLVPLMEFPQLVQGINLIGKWGMFLFLILTQAAAVEIRQKKRAIVFVLFCLLPFSYGFFKLTLKTVPEWITKCAFIPLAVNVAPHERIYELVKKITDQKRVKLFIVPESYFPFEITEKSLTIKALQVHALQEGQLCLFGAHKKKGDKLFNTLFFVNKRRIILSYEKTHLIPFFEYNPYYHSLIAHPFNFFLHKKVPFSCASDKPTHFEFNGIGPFLPVVCSELFCNEFPQKKSTYPFIAILNDSHFGATRFPDIMLLSAQFQALTHKRPLAYCSSFLAYFINEQGQKIKEIQKI